MAGQLRLRAGMPKKTTRAKAAPPAVGQKRFLGLLSAVVAAVVLMLKVAIVTPLTETEAGILHVAGSLAAVGAMEQLRLTMPVNPPAGVMVMVEVLPEVAPAATVIGPLLLRAKLGVVTFTVTTAVWVSEPDVPVTVTV
jgi:hypothetical protein